MTIKQKEILELEDVLKLQLKIPDYQRPYRWSDVQVSQLINDILHHMRIGKQKYRLGTIVLHQKEQGAINIVDGQQRLLTLSMLCYYLDDKSTIGLLTEDLPSISVDNLQHNAAHIKQHLAGLNDTEKQLLKSFLLHQCELVCVTLDDISEAFQFFDSQNSRGKSLETYDLLKAFHLREMQRESADEVVRCVENWEQRATVTVDDQENVSLKTIINDVLFPIRCWTKGEKAVSFKNSQVDIFKGVNFGTHYYPHIAPLRAVESIAISNAAELVSLWGGQMTGYQFQSAQVMVNGKRFFEYVEHYATLYHRLFILRHEQLKKYLEVLDDYPGRHRVGDQYVKKLFFCTVMYYYDKFGEYGFANAVGHCFRWSYRLRLEQARVQIESINSHVLASSGLLRRITHAIHPNDVLNFPISPVAKVEGTNVDKLKEFFEIKA